MRRWTMAFMISALTVSHAQAAQHDDAAAIFDDLKAGAPGCGASAIQDGKVIWSGGFGSADIATGRPIKPETVFNIASDSKQFTAFAILLLQQDGKLKLDDPIRKYLPELGQYADPITIRMLIHHTGGLRDYMFFALLAGIPTSQKMTEQQAIAFVFAQDGAEFQAGSEFSYSNTGYLLLSVIVERLTGGTMKAFVENRILMPLGMSASSVVDSYPDGIALLSRAYARKDDAWVIDESRWENTGDGQVHTNVMDIARWIDNLATGQVGERALAKQMQKDGSLNDGSAVRYAYGLELGFYRGQRTVSHSGGWAGYNSQITWLPEIGLAAAVFCNAYGLDPHGRANKLIDVFAGKSLGRPVPAPPTSELVAAAKLDARQIKPGVYAEPSGRVIEIERSVNGLSLRQDDDEAHELVEVQPKVFASGTDDTREYFVVPATGQIQSDGHKIFTRLDTWQPENLARYAGVYETKVTPGQIVTFIDNGRLKIRLAGEEQILKPIGEHIFQTAGWGVMTFTSDGASFTGTFARNLIFTKAAP